jgi:hypothetical protein
VEQFDLADEAGAPVHVAGIAALRLQVLLGLVVPAQPLEIDVAAIHHVDRAGLGHELIQEPGPSVALDRLGQGLVDR